MGPFIEGVCTVEIDKISEIVAQEKANSELYRTKSYDRVYYATYGPFTMGEYKCEVRVSPCYDHLYFILNFKDNAEAFEKCGYIFLLQDHNSGRKWTIQDSTILNEEKGFIFSSQLTNISNLPVNRVGVVPIDDVKKYSKNDCMLIKLVLWVLLDDSKLRPPEPTPQPDPKPNQPNYTPPEFIGKLLSGQFADIHFIVKEQTFVAHRAILTARSSVFKSQLLALQNNTSCWNNLFISVQHMDVLTFKYLLHFIYTDSLPSDFEESTPPERYHLMYIAARHFEIEGLKLICEEKLTKAVTDTIVSTLKLIEHEECSLQKIVMKD